MTLSGPIPNGFLPGAARGLAALLLVLLLLGVGAPAAAQSGTAPPGGGVAASVTGSAQPQPSASDVWRSVRQGEAGFVNLPPDQAAVLIQSEGEEWRHLRNDSLIPWTGWAVLGMIGALALFFLLRGRIRIEGGPSGRLILRFTGIERFAHWLTAGSFILLALTGLNLIFGRDLLLPWMGPAAFATLTEIGKLVHNFGGFAFIAGLLLILVLWVRHNFWDRYDLGWILKGGGIVGTAHPPAAKFNFGQKVVFWLVILVGAVVSASGVALLFPFALPQMDMAAMQLLVIVHLLSAAFLIVAILAHIYIGTVGMEGAASAMTSGYVDVRWAEHHHSAWVDKVRADGTAAEMPAETPKTATPSAAE